MVIDNSGQGLVRAIEEMSVAVRVIENEWNAGFGAAVNQAFVSSQAPLLATLNDDAVACPQWLAAMVAAVESQPDAGMWASQVRLSGKDTLDSAGMLLCPDGSSKQRGHGQQAHRFAESTDVLFPSGSAAMYRREMLEEIGVFDESFFLYCEDTDLGLRARWAGWKCRYVPGAVVEHRYSHSAGRASGLKARYVERNRVFLIVKNFPFRMIAQVPFYVMVRYMWHLAGMIRGRGAAGEFGREGSALTLIWYVVNAHLEVLRHGAHLLEGRRQTMARARITAREFTRLAATHAISPREVASL